ncbi:terminase large subunit domain-containing protein [Agitococcus lubricus]|uniref:Terminase family protein n=1 Tax=Agitococcus lubricus TaxID=1077255 RepID=A0A2T5IT94_9GAMM|nr:terminase family protein [Agitococcus lubricus]PTQ87084.1 hypothetical protein C8N29_1246 [Agitococcus lubricus]
MQKKKTLLDDPRWWDFIEKYAYDIGRFAVEVCGMNDIDNQAPTWQQFDLFDLAQENGCRVSVSSGHGSGKTRSAGIIALWHLCCYANSIFMFSSPTMAQLREEVWKEITICHTFMANSEFAWLADYIEVKTESVYIKGHKKTWYVIAKTAPKGKPENMAGKHGDWYMVWVDEASGVADANFGVITGALTDKRNRMVITSQPTRGNGFFYDTHHSLSKDQGGVWDKLVFNSEESPIVSDEFIAEKLIQYGGRDNPEYQIKVLGKFPDRTDIYLNSEAQVTWRMGKSVIGPEMGYGYLICVDVGAGEYRDYSAIIVVRVTGYGDHGEQARRVELVDVPLYSNSRDLTFLSGKILEVYTEYENANVLIDRGGMGVAVCQNLENLGVPVTRVNWGDPCFNNELRKRFVNQRAQALVMLARAIKEERLGFLDQRYQTQLLQQGSRIPYFFDEKARYKIMDKQSMLSEGIKSPDLWDALAFAFLEGAYYTLSEKSRQISQSTKKAQKESIKAKLRASLNK